MACAGHAAHLQSAVRHSVTRTLSHSSRRTSHHGHAYEPTWPSFRHSSANTAAPLWSPTPFLCPQSARSSSAGSCEGCHDTSPHPGRRAQLTSPQAKPRRPRPQPPSRLLQRAAGWPCRATQQRDALLNAGSLPSTAPVRWVFSLSFEEILAKLFARRGQQYSTKGN